MLACKILFHVWLLYSCIVKCIVFGYWLMIYYNWFYFNREGFGYVDNILTWSHFTKWQSFCQTHAVHWTDKENITHLTKYFLTFARLTFALTLSIVCQLGILSKNINKFERVQRRATKLVPGLVKLPYKTRLQHLDLYSIYCHRQEFTKLMMNHLTRVSPASSVVSPEAMT